MNESNVSGKLDQVVGKVKQGIGEATGNQSLANSGAADQVKGNVKEAWGDVKDTASDADSKARTNTQAEQSANNTRDSATSTAEDTKNSVKGKLDEFRRDHNL